MLRRVILVVIISCISIIMMILDFSQQRLQPRWFDETCQTQPEDTLNIINIISIGAHIKHSFSQVLQNRREHQNTKQQPHTHTHTNKKKTHQTTETQNHTPTANRLGPFKPSLFSLELAIWLADEKIMWMPWWLNQGDGLQSHLCEVGSKWRVLKPYPKWRKMNPYPPEV